MSVSYCIMFIVCHRSMHIDFSSSSNGHWRLYIIINHAVSVNNSMNVAWSLNQSRWCVSDVLKLISMQLMVAIASKSRFRISVERHYKRYAACLISASVYAVHCWLRGLLAEMPSHLCITMPRRRHARLCAMIIIKGLIYWCAYAFNQS